MTDPYQAFIFEVQAVRDEFVKEVVTSKNPRSKDILHPKQDFFNLKYYDKDFLKKLQNKFDVKTPTVAVFLKSKLLYPRSIEKDSKYEGDPINGFWLKSEGKQEICDEVLEMQKVLDLLSTKPRRVYRVEADI